MISVFDDEYSMANDCNARNPTPNVWELSGDFRSALHHVKAKSQPGTGYGNLTGKDACCLTVSGKKTQHISKVDFTLKNTVTTTRIPLDECDTYLQTKGPTGFSS